MRHDPDRLAAVVIGIVDETTAQRASYRTPPARGKREFAGPYLTAPRLREVAHASSA